MWLCSGAMASDWYAHPTGPPAVHQEGKDLRPVVDTVSVLGRYRAASHPRLRTALRSHLGSPGMWYQRCGSTSEG